MYTFRIESYVTIHYSYSNAANYGLLTHIGFKFCTNYSDECSLRGFYENTKHTDHCNCRKTNCVCPWQPHWPILYNLWQPYWQILYNLCWCVMVVTTMGVCVNQAYSRLSTIHSHITDCQLDSVVYAGVCVWVVTTMGEEKSV